MSNNSSSQIQYPVLISIPVGLLGFLANSILLYIIVTSKRLKDPAYALIANVIVCDCLSSLQFFLLFVAPFYLSSLSYQAGDIFCKLSLYSLYSTYNASVFSLTAISIYRYKAVVYTNISQIRSRSQVLRNVTKATIIIWTVSFLLSLPAIFVATHHQISIGYCDIKYFHNYKYLTLVLVTGMTVITYIAPLIIMIINYYRVFKRLTHIVPCDHQERKKDNEDHRKWSLMKMLIIVTSLFMLFTWPIFISVDILAIEQKTFYDIRVENYSVFIICFMTFPISTLISIFNPILYTVFDKNIYREVQKKLTFSRCGIVHNNNSNLNSLDLVSAVPSIRPTPNKTFDE